MPRDKISIESACYLSGVPTILLSAGVSGVEVDEIILGTYVMQVALAATPDSPIYMIGEYNNCGWFGGKTRSMYLGILMCD